MRIYSLDQRKHEVSSGEEDKHGWLNGHGPASHEISRVSTSKKASPAEMIFYVLIVCVLLCGMSMGGHGVIWKIL